MKKHAYPLAVIAVFSVLFWSLPSYYKQSEAFQNITNATRDIFFKLRHASQDLPDAVREIFIVTIDQESSDKLQSRWPWPRDIFTQIVRQLTRAGAKVIGLNVSFTGLEGPEDVSTRELAEAMREHGRVIIGFTFDSEGRPVQPNEWLAEAVARTGYLEKIIDSDFAIRRSYLLRSYRTPRLPGLAAGIKSDNGSSAFEASFPLQLMAAYVRANGGGDPEFDRDRGALRFRKPPRTVRLDADGSYTINYLATEKDFERISAWKIAQGKFRPDDVKDKIVLIGLGPSLFLDSHQTPFGIMSGIGIHANEFISVLSGRLLKFVSNAKTFFLSWLVSLGVLVLFLLRRFWLGLAGFLAAFFGLFLASQIAFARDVVIEPFLLCSGPLLATIVGITANSLKLLMENRGLESKVIQDKMTGLYTYDFLRMRLEDEWKRCRKAKIPISVVMTDLDHFKKINDTLGHEVGNEMIRRAAQVIKESVRGYDIVSRYGGDEFVILLWHSSLQEARAYRDRLRNLFHAMAQTLEPALQNASISIGVATYDPVAAAGQPANTQALVEEADKDLFQDKQERRKEKSR